MQCSIHVSTSSTTRYCVSFFNTNVSTVDVFCGEANCYEVLGLTRDAEMKDIKKVQVVFENKYR